MSWRRAAAGAGRRGARLATSADSSSTAFVGHLHDPGWKLSQGLQGYDVHFPRSTVTTVETRTKRGQGQIRKMFPSLFFPTLRGPMPQF